MSVPAKRVVRFDLWYHPAMAELLSLDADIDLVTCDLGSPRQAALAAFASAHVYQISSAKDEIPPYLFVSRMLPVKIAVASETECHDDAAA